MAVVICPLPRGRYISRWSMIMSTRRKTDLSLYGKANATCWFVKPTRTGGKFVGRRAPRLFMSPLSTSERSDVPLCHRPNLVQSPPTSLKSASADRQTKISTNVLLRKGPALAGHLLQRRLPHCQGNRPRLCCCGTPIRTRG